ncbi:MAG: hypothetical protein AAAC48_11100 [Phyllobacterium sp.]|uniref:hypothetical protein n=1 Tax=Phyllobacterium sp. TaxID=1871046 RepID=UPI0030F078DF
MSGSIQRLKALLCMTETSLELVTSVTEDAGSHVVERLRFRLSDGSQVRGFLTRPVDIQVPRPAILYAHAHGGRYEIGANELGGEGLPFSIPRAVLAREGYIMSVSAVEIFTSKSPQSEQNKTQRPRSDGEY